MGRVALIYLESPANPTNALVDVEAVARRRDAIFGDDESRRSRSTTPSSARSGRKPLKQGADIVVYCLTKYAGGHCDLVAGGVLGAKALSTRSG